MPLMNTTFYSVNDLSFFLTIELFFMPKTHRSNSGFYCFRTLDKDLNIGQPPCVSQMLNIFQIPRLAISALISLSLWAPRADQKHSLSLWTISPRSIQYGIWGHWKSRFSHKNQFLCIISSSYMQHHNMHQQLHITASVQNPYSSAVHKNIYLK
jgi:hypothetical protein